MPKVDISWLLLELFGGREPGLDIDRHRGETIEHALHFGPQHTEPRDQRLSLGVVARSLRAS